MSRCHVLALSLLLLPACHTRVAVSSRSAAAPTYVASPEVVAAPAPGMRRLTLTITADDAFVAYLDGQPIAAHRDWTEVQRVDLDVAPGEHVVAVYAEDLERVISGMNATIEVDGHPVAWTGGAEFLAMPDPPAGFESPGFDDSRWAAARVCPDTSPWDGRLPGLTASGAQWVWGGDCRALGRAGFRVRLSL